MQNLKQLSLALRNNSQAKADLAGLDEQYGEATKLRDSQSAKINQYGTVSPFSVIADVINNSRGRKNVRELAPQRTAARTGVADTANALPLFNAQQKINAATQAQSNANRTFDYGVTQDEQEQERALKQATAKEAQRVEKLRLEAERFGINEEQDQTAINLDATNREEDLAIAEGKRTTETYIDPKTLRTSTVTIAPDGKKYQLGADGKETSKDVTGLVKYSDYAGDGGSSSFSLTAPQLQRGLKAYRKEVNKLSPIVIGVNALNEELATLPNNMRDIPGIGYGEGGTSLGAQGLRAFSGMFNEGKSGKIHAKWTQAIAPLIRVQAGLTQTKTELERVEQQFGANWLSSEATFREQYPEVMKALAADIQTMEGTFLPGVKDYYNSRVKGQGELTLAERAKFVNPFEPNKKVGPTGPVNEQAGTNKTEAELLQMTDEEFNTYEAAVNASMK